MYNLEIGPLVCKALAASQSNPQQRLSSKIFAFALSALNR